MQLLLLIYAYRQAIPERTKLMCTPRARCRPLHSKHINIPNETEAHCGFFPSQSAQI